ncbi:MAG: ABC transporter permease [Chloroflexota bacterium]
MSQAEVESGRLDRTAVDGPTERGPRMMGALPLVQAYGSIAALVLLLIIARLLSPTFLDWINIRQQMLIFAFGVGLIAVGQTLVILTGGIDLSVGSLFAVGSVISAQLVMNNASMFWVFALPMVVATGLGILSGTIVARAKIQPIVVTLAMMIAARGVAELVTGDNILRPSSDQFSAITSRAFGTATYTIPYAVGLVLLIYGIVTFVMTRTSLGRYILAVGGNEQATRLSGIAVDRVKIAAYAISGLLAGLAGVLWASYESTADPQNDGLYLELATIAAVVVGGTSLLGGRGSVWRTLIGALIITVLNALLIQMNREQPDQLIVQGLIIVGAVMLQRTRK